jgi:hypothetical protein
MAGEGTNGDPSQGACEASYQPHQHGDTAESTAPFSEEGPQCWPHQSHSTRQPAGV